MSGASPKHTKNGRHKACLGGCANSCHREGTENLGGWANLGQTGCPETCSRDSCRGQRLSPTDVQTTPSAGGRGPLLARRHPGREEPRGQPAGTSCSLQVGATAGSTLGKHLPSTFYMFSARRIQQQTPQAATEKTMRHRAGGERPR